MSLYLVNIQPNSKLHPPTKTFWIRSCIQRMAKCDVILNPPLQNPGYASVNCSAERLHELNKFLLSAVIHT